jgi:hypothetical protein
VIGLAFTVLALTLISTGVFAALWREMTVRWLGLH